MILGYMADLADVDISEVATEGKHQGPVVQSIVNLMMSLRRQFVKYMPTTLSCPLLFFC